ncbi:MAG: phosphoribosylaminoimidazolesuccinocarboxamide synthase [Methanomassiliicoccales archaeon]|nr:MAG: phosphoribosylaminoimidazolesuccinocarboxamide synthase [Methanomassiliicoccales archaeon]
MEKKFLKSGKVKEVYEVEENMLEFKFTDQISVFDKVIPTLVPHKGETLCRTSAHWFTVAKSMGIHSHFEGLSGPNLMQVKKVDVIRDYAKLTPETTNYLIPLEFICRHYVAGSLLDRLKSGDVKPEDVGFPSGHTPKYGEKLPEPFFETTTKLEEFDRKLTIEEGMEMAGLTKEEFQKIKDTVLKLDEKIGEEVRKRGLIHVDGKKEFAFDSERNLMLIDTFGTADEDRFWDAASYEEGKFVEMSKEFVRQHYRSISYLDVLEDARKKGEEEPDIPALPDDVTPKVSELYIKLFERLTGEKFR